MDKHDIDNVACNADLGDGAKDDHADAGGSGSGAFGGGGGGGAADDSS